MNARYPYLFALALALPLASCRMVGQRPDFGVVGDALTPAENDRVLVESKPTGSVPIADYQRPTPVVEAPPPFPTAPELSPTPAPAAPPAARPAAGSSRFTAWLTTAQNQVYSTAQRADTAIRKRTTQLQQQPHPAPTAAPRKPAPSAPNGSYTVCPGDSLARIARFYRVPLGSLAAVNGIDLQTPTIRPGQQLIIPQGNAAIVPPPLPSSAPAASPSPAPAAPTAPARAKQYRVCAGDTLYRIARKHGITLKELLHANQLDEQGARSVRVGTLLTIPAKP